MKLSAKILLSFLLLFLINNIYSFDLNTLYPFLPYAEESSEEETVIKLRYAVKFLPASYFARILTEIIPTKGNFTERIIGSDCMHFFIEKLNNTKLDDYLKYLIKYSAKSFPDYGDEEGCIAKDEMEFLLFTIKYEISDPTTYQGYFKYLPFISNGYSFYGICINKVEACTIDLPKLIKAGVNGQILYGMEKFTINTFSRKADEAKSTNKFSVVLIILGIYIIIRLAIWFAGSKFFKEEEKAKPKIKKDEDEDANDEEDEENEEDESKSKEKEEKGELLEKKTKEIILTKDKIHYKFYFIYKVTSFTEAFKVLFNIQNNPIHNEKDLYLILFFRFLAIFLKAAYINFQFVIQNPSKEINNTNIFNNFIIWIIRFSSFSDIILIITESSLVAYKLMSFIRKKTQNGEEISIKFFINFFLRIIPSFLLILIIFFSFYFDPSPIIRFYSLFGFDTHSTKLSHLKKNLMECKDCVQKAASFIPFYMNYAKFNDQNNIDDSCFPFMIIFFNLLYGFILCILILYISFKLKNHIFDIIISILFFASFALPNSISCESYLDNHNYINFSLILGESCSTTFTHLFINYYFLGFLFGLALFYNNDITKDNSLQNSNKVYLPFYYLKSLIRFFFSVPYFLYILILILSAGIMLLLSCTFYIYTGFNLNVSSQEDSYKTQPLNAFDKFLYLNEKSVFCLVFLAFLIHLTTYKSDNKLKEFGNNTFFAFFNRMGYEIYAMTDIEIKIFYFLFDFNYTISSVNLIIVTIGAMCNILLFSIVLYVTIHLPIKIIVKRWLRDRSEFKEDYV